MKLFLRIVGILLLSLLIGVVIGSLPLLWLWWMMSNEQPGDATGDMIFIVLPIALLLFLTATVISAVIMLVILLVKARRRRRRY